MDWIVFDVDGVLIDVTESYDIAVKLTVEYFLDVVVDKRYVEELRIKGALGDDYNLSEALLCGYGTKDIQEFVHKFPSGGTVEWLRENHEPVVSGDDIKKIFDTYYLGDFYREKLFDYDGLWKREKRLIDLELLDRAEELFKIGIVTGRSGMEMELAERVIGHEFTMKVTSDQYLKPDPRAFEALVGEDDGVYIGDSRTDEVLVERYNRMGKGKFGFLMVRRDVDDVNHAVRGLLDGTRTP